MARILVVSSSLFGANAELAALIRNVLAERGTEFRLRGVKQLVLGDQAAPAARGILARGEDLAWADGFIFTSPSHTGLLSASLKAFIDEHHDAAETGAFIDKTFTAMATGAYQHAGQEHVVDELNTAAAVWGCVLVPPSGADAAVNHLNGNPWGLSFTLRHGRVDGRQAAERVLSSHLTRFVAVTDALAATRNSRRPAEPEKFGTSNRKAEKTVHTPTNPLRATDVFVGPQETPREPAASAGSQPRSSRLPGEAASRGSSGGDGGGSAHSPTNPLRATDVFRGPHHAGSGTSAGSPASMSGSPGHHGSGHSSSGGGSGHSPTNPLRATDVFRGPQQSRR